MVIPSGARKSASAFCLVLLPTLLTLLSGCGASANTEGASADGEVGHTSSAIYGGTLDNDSAHDAVVALRIGDGSPFELCTGTLIAPNVVLTARHCVSATIVDDIECDSKGNSLNGIQLGTDVDPATIHVMTGPSPDFASSPMANGRQIFHPSTNVLCNDDIAIVVLDQAIAGITPMGVRLSEAASTGALIDSIGYGQNDQGSPLGTRFEKDDVKIIASGSTAKNASTGQPATGPNEFQVGKSICQGDSGGPAIDETTNEVVGVVSRGVDCDLTFGHLYTKPSAFLPLFQAAYTAAGQKTLLAQLDTTQMSESVTSATATSASDTSTDASTAGGCAVAAPGTNPSSGLALLPLVGLALVAARRRRG